jgi:hypothetical protein
LDRLTLIVSGVLLLVFLVALSGCGVPAPAPEPAPEPTTVPPPAPAPEPAPAPAPEPASEPQDGVPLLVVHPGSFCDPIGAVGVTDRGTPMVCGPTTHSTRARWHQPG